MIAFFLLGLFNVIVLTPLSSVTNMSSELIGIVSDEGVASLTALPTNESTKSQYLLIAWSYKSSNTTLQCCTLVTMTISEYHVHVFQFIPAVPFSSSNKVHHAWSTSIAFTDSSLSWNNLYTTVLKIQYSLVCTKHRAEAYSHYPDPLLIPLLFALLSLTFPYHQTGFVS